MSRCCVRTGWLCTVVRTDLWNGCLWAYDWATVNLDVLRITPDIVKVMVVPED